MYHLSVIRCVCGAIAAAAGFATFMASAVDINANTTWTATDAATHTSDDIVIAGGVTLTVNLAASETATLGGVISGAGALKLTGNGGLVLSGANTFSGGFTLQNTATTAYTYTGAFVSAANASAFGTGKVTLDSFLCKVWLDASGTYDNPIDVLQVGHIAFGRTLSGGSYKLTKPISATCDVILGEGGLTKGKGGTLELADACTVDADAYDVIVATQGGSTLRLYGKVTARALRGSSNNKPDYYSYNQLGFAGGSLYLYNENDVDVVSAVGASFSFESGSSVAERTEMTDSYLRPDPSYRGTSTYYLDTDLTVGSVPVWRLDACPAITPSVTWGIWRGNNGKERTLTVVGGGTYVSQAQFEDYNNGKMSFHWNPQGDGADAAKIVLSNRAHTTSGKFTVSKGEVAVCGAQASLKKLSSLEVKAGAKFTLETDVADPLAGLRELVVSDTSAVTLPAGTSCTLSTFKINGQKLFDGTYPGTAYDWLFGDGVTFTVAGSEWTKADIEALTEGVAIPEGKTLIVKTVAGETIAFGQKISGSGSVKVIGDGEIVFSAANDYAGGLFVDGAATVRGTDGAAFGTGAVQLGGKKAAVYLQTGTATFANDFVLTNNAVIAFVPTAANAQITVGGSVSATADFYVAVSAKGEAPGVTGCSYNFAGPINAAGMAMTFMGTLSGSVDVNFRGPITAARVRSFSLTGNGPYDSLFGTGWGYANYGNSRFHFYAANQVDVFVPYWAAFYPKHPQAFSGISTLTSSDYRKDSGYHHASTVDFGGFSQTVGSLEMLDINGYAIGKENTCGVLTSSKAATLTAVGGGTYVSDALFGGALSFDYNPPDAADMIVLSNRAHTTTGRLTVSKGTAYAVGEKTSFKSLTAIEVKSGATFRLDTAVANALTAVKEIKVEEGGLLEIVGGATPFAGGQAVVEIATGGSIKLGEGVVAQFGALRLDGTMIPDDDYTSATWLSGSGTVKIDSSVLLATLWKNAASGDWATAANWTKGVPQSGTEALVTASGKSYVVSVSQDAGAIGPLTVGNAAAGETATVAVAAPMTLSAAAKSLVVGNGGCVEVAAGGSVDLPRGSLSSDNVSVSVQDGGVLAVAGGEMTLTNYTGQVNAGHGGKIAVSSGILRTKPGSGGQALTVAEGGAIKMTGGQLLFSSYGWNGDGLVICKGAKLDVSGDAVVGPLDGMTYTRVFGDGEITFRGHSTFGRQVTGGVGGWGYCFATGSGAPTGTVNFIESARFYDTSSSIKIDRGAGLVAQLIFGSATNHTFSWKTFVGGGDGGRGEVVVTNGVLTQNGEGMRLAGAYEKQGATAALTAEGSLRVAGKGEVDFFTGNKATGEICGLVVGDGSIATTNKTTGLGYGDTMRGYAELAEGGMLLLGESAALVVGVGNPNVFGRLVQTGGTFDNRSTSDYGQAAVGMGGGTGEWLMSGGKATLKCNLYVGGALLADDFHRTAPPSNSGRLYVGERDYPKQAKGLLKLTGGAMSLRRDLILSKDGEGVLELGPGGNLTVDGALNALAGSKLVVDITGYAGRSRTIATFGSVTRWFDTVELKGETEGYAVLVDPAKGRVSVKHLVGSVLMVR